MIAATNVLIRFPAERKEAEFIVYDPESAPIALKALEKFEVKVPQGEFWLTKKPPHAPKDFKRVAACK